MKPKLKLFLWQLVTTTIILAIFFSVRSLIQHDPSDAFTGIILALAIVMALLFAAIFGINANSVAAGFSIVFTATAACSSNKQFIGYEFTATFFSFAAALFITCPIYVSLISHSNDDYDDMILTHRYILISMLSQFIIIIIPMIYFIKK